MPLGLDGVQVRVATKRRRVGGRGGSEGQVKSKAEDLRGRHENSGGTCGTDITKCDWAAQVVVVVEYSSCGTPKTFLCVFAGRSCYGILCLG